MYKLRQLNYTCRPLAREREPLRHDHGGRAFPTLRAELNLIVPAGHSRMTVSLCVIMMEATRCDEVLPFVMVAIICAKGVADRFNDGNVLRRIRLKGLPFVQRLPHLTQRRGRFTAASVARRRDHPLLPACAL